MSDCGIQSDQAISNYYSELNHLTQELQGSNSDLDVALDKIGLNENMHRNSTKPFYVNEDIRVETDGEDDESSPFHNRMNENIDHISQYVSDVHNKTVLHSHDLNGRQSDGSTDELDGDRLNVGDFSSLSMLHSVNLKSTKQKIFFCRLLDLQKKTFFIFRHISKQLTDTVIDGTKPLAW